MGSLISTSIRLRGSSRLTIAHMKPNIWAICPTILPISNFPLLILPFLSFSFLFNCTKSQHTKKKAWKMAQHTKKLNNCKRCGNKRDWLKKESKESLYTIWFGFSQNLCCTCQSQGTYWSTEEMTAVEKTPNFSEIFPKEVSLLVLEVSSCFLYCVGNFFCDIFRIHLWMFANWINNHWVSCWLFLKILS